MRSTDIAHTTPLRRDLPPFRAGDTVRVHVKIREGEKERIQVFEGVVLRRKQGGRSATFTVRKLSYGVVRRSRLYYLRELRGKKARLRSKVRDLSSLISEEAASAKAAPPEGAAASEPGTAVTAAATEGAAANEAAPEAGEVEASAEAAEEPKATAEAAEEPEKTDA